MPCQAGPIRPLSEQARELAAKNIGLAVLCAKPWMRALPSLRDEFIGAAHVGLCLAARDWDPARGGIGTFIKVRVWSECNHVRKNFRRQCRTAPGRRVGGLYEVIDPTTLGQPGDGDLARILLGTLPPRDAAMVRAVVIEGRARTEVGREHGCMRWAVYATINQSLAALRRHPMIVELKGKAR